MWLLFGDSKDTTHMHPMMKCRLLPKRGGLMGLLYYLIFGIIGAGIGVAEVFLLKRSLNAITLGYAQKAVIPMLIKIVIYAAAAAVSILFFSKYLIAMGIGFAPGMVVTVIIVFCVKMRKDG